MKKIMMTLLASTMMMGQAHALTININDIDFTFNDNIDYSELYDAIQAVKDNTETAILKELGVTNIQVVQNEEDGRWAVNIKEGNKDNWLAGAVGESKFDVFYRNLDNYMESKKLDWQAGYNAGWDVGHSAGYNEAFDYATTELGLEGGHIVIGGEHQLITINKPDGVSVSFVNGNVNELTITLDDNYGLMQATVTDSINHSAFNAIIDGVNVTVSLSDGYMIVPNDFVPAGYEPADQDSYTISTTVNDEPFEHTVDSQDTVNSLYNAAFGHGYDSGFAAGKTFQAAASKTLGESMSWTTQDVSISEEGVISVLTIGTNGLGNTYSSNFIDYAENWNFVHTSEISKAVKAVSLPETADIDVTNVNDDAISSLYKMTITLSNGNTKTYDVSSTVKAAIIKGQKQAEAHAFDIHAMSLSQFHGTPNVSVLETAEFAVDYYNHGYLIGSDEIKDKVNAISSSKSFTGTISNTFTAEGSVSVIESNEVIDWNSTPKEAATIISANSTSVIYQLNELDVSNSDSQFWNSETDSIYDAVWLVHNGTEWTYEFSEPANINNNAFVVGNFSTDLEDLTVEVKGAIEDAYNTGYDHGYENGYDDGWSDGYAEGVNDTKAAANN